MTVRARRVKFFNRGVRRPAAPRKKALFPQRVCLWGAVLPVFLACFFSCAHNPSLYHEIDDNIRNASYALALSSIKSDKIQRSIYTEKNAVLLCLDRGLINHYAGQWEDSSRDLEEGERLIEAAFTKSVSQEIGSYLLNDNAKDYSGEDYEDLYTNVFNALNYYHREDSEGALVEIRRVNEKLSYLADKYETAREKVISSNPDLGSREYAGDAVRFSNSALARYLGLLFYRSAGLADDARIDREELYRAYELAPEVYHHPPPSSLKDELSVPPGKGRLNIIGFTGQSPVKEEVNLPIPLPLPAPNNYARLALPRMVDRASAIQSAEVILDNGQTFHLELLEDMSRVAQETFKAKYSLIVLKTTARTIAKNVASAGVAEAMEERTEGLGALIGLLGKITADLTEQADLRVSRYFPGRAHVGGINLDPGVYSITVNFYGSRGLVASEQRHNVHIRADTLNLSEFVCLK